MAIATTIAATTVRKNRENDGDLMMEKGYRLRAEGGKVLEGPSLAAPPIVGFRHEAPPASGRFFSGQGDRLALYPNGMSTSQPALDPQNLSSLTGELARRLYKVAYYQAGSLNAAEDAVKETILRFLTSLKKDPALIRSPLGWCLRVLTRLARRQDPTVGREVPIESVGERLSSRDPDPAGSAQAGEHRALLRRSLGELPEIENSQ